MKKLLALFIITSSVTLLHADPYGRCASAGYGQPGPDMYSQNQGQVQQYRQGQTQGYQQGQQYGNAGLPYDYQAPQQYGNAGQQNGNPGQQYGNAGQQNGNGVSHQGMTPLQYGSQEQKQPGYPQHSDSRMAEQIQDTLRKDPSNKFSNISVNVNEGYVTLKGSVANQNDKAALEQRVREMPGVQNVNNQVTIK